MWKPPKVIELQTGYALAAFKGFVAFWNWLAKFVYYINGDGSIVIDDEQKDRPVIRLAGFKDAEDENVPSKSGDSIAWNKISDLVNTDDDSVTRNSDEKLSIVGYDSASVGQVPVKREDGIVWENGGGGGGDITVTGTDGSTATGSKLSFASAADSAVGVHVSKDAATGIITATISVHWKT